MGMIALLSREIIAVEIVGGMLDDTSDDFTYKFDINAFVQSHAIGRGRTARRQYSEKAVNCIG